MSSLNRSMFKFTVIAYNLGIPSFYGFAISVSVAGATGGRSSEIHILKVADFDTRWREN